MKGKLILFAFIFLGAFIIFFSTTKNKSRFTTILIDNVPLRVETVSTPSGMERGLMYRRSLPENQGMLFVFDGPSYCSFWMKNTYVPLSIAFISEDSIITQIEDMFPLDTLDFHISKELSKYAVEVNKDWFRRHKVKVGDRIRGIPFQ